MTQEEKQLLLTDICARLPYGVFVRYENNDIAETRELGLGTLHDFMFENADVKPYLRPMSSMTKEEEKEYNSFIIGQQPFDSDFSAYPIEHKLLYEFDINSYIDWINAHHFDYRGLIKKGLALEAPKNMYRF